MKKLLLFCTLFIGITSCAGLPKNTSIQTIMTKGMSKEQVCKSDYFFTTEFADGWRAICHGRWQKHYRYDAKNQTEIIWNGETQVFFVFEDVTQPMKCTNMWCKYGTGRLKKVVRSMSSAEEWADPKMSVIAQKGGA